MYLLPILLLASLAASVYGSETLPWGVERIRAYLVWDNNMDMAVDQGANAGQYVSIAVIDSGIDYWTDDQGNIHYHPDLEDNVAGGRRFRHLYPNCYVEEWAEHEDIDGHGTHVAGTIAAVDNDIGVIGTAPKTKIYALQVIAWNEEGYAKAIATAINWAVGQGVDIISISLGLVTDYTTLREASDNAYAQGVLLIGASGSWGETFVRYPARYASVIAVGAVYQNLNRPNWSNTGPELEFVAPGVDINSTWLDGGYRLDSGTSMAVPHVTATAALIWSSKIDPTYDDGDGMWSNTEVRLKLRHMALDLGLSGRDNDYGFGLINAWATNQRPLGDINIDYKVDILDVALAAKAFSSYPGHPRWDPRGDMNLDNIVDITDVSLIAQNFGQVDP